jgi:osmotically-inducible protein OsmY
VPLLTLASAILSTGPLCACGTYGACRSDSCRDDARITSQVQASFEQHAELEPPNLLTVHTRRGVVYLNGLVATDLQKWDAESVASEASGVARVVNSIAVTER